ncbi:MAG: alpha/beta hydrolase [Propionibacterium sp.]|nr:alpha/beta hydrolase [Propionibacterium sp.]HMQ39516.1 alpha/beta hydrolase [Micropruina sp.]
MTTQITGQRIAPPRHLVEVNGTTLAVTRIGSGHSVLVIHGGGEDAAMLMPQAEALASAGLEAIVYDRRGTGASGREDWPGGGAGQHAADAAALIGALRLDRVTVLGVSSGGVIALAVAAGHPGCLARAIVWEPPAAGVIPGGAELTAQLMAPIDAHLAAHPGDFVGAQALLLELVLGFPVSVDDPAFEAARANAEPMIRDEPAITLAAFTAEQLGGREITLAVGSSPNEVVAGAVAVLAELTGRPPVQVAADHEVYLSDPSVLTAIVLASQSGVDEPGGNT